MKTIEEKARVYAKKLVVLENKDKFSDEANLRAAEYYAYKSHLAGYTEAIRWRDPKDELPKEGVNVFVKMIRSGEYGEETIYTSSHVVNDFYHDSESNPFGCEGHFPAGNGGRVKVIVIGWRPIE